MVHKSVINVDVSCDKCKKEVLSVVSDIEGVNKMEADPAKCTLTVIGDADPFAIIQCLRKAGKNAHFVSVGPPPPPPKEEKKPEPCKCPCPCKCTCPKPCPYPYSYPINCGICQPNQPFLLAMNCQDPAPPICSIM